jgi:hypothetical protein
VQSAVLLAPLYLVAQVVEIKGIKLLFGLASRDFLTAGRYVAMTVGTSAAAFTTS